MIAKLELGSPMICLYLLGNPNHYTSHRFVLFYWLSFVQEVRKAWDEDLTGEPPQKIGMLKQNGKIVRVSYVHDYIHRPEELDDMSLYTWISAYKRGRLPKKTKTKTAQVSSLDREALEETDHEEDKDRDVAQDHPTDNDSDGHEGRPEILDEDTTANSKGMLRFMADHLLFSTHGVRRLPSPLVPNFVGWTLPHRDQSDQEFYCMTMLTLL